jgi:hypothetical protein
MGARASHLTRSCVLGHPHLLQKYGGPPPIKSFPHCYHVVMVLQVHLGNVHARALILSRVGGVDAIVIAVPIEYSCPAIELIISIAVRGTVNATAEYGGQWQSAAMHSGGMNA